MQKFDRPNRMAFDLNDAKAWKPFFTKNFPNPDLPTVHVTVILSSCYLFTICMKYMYMYNYS